MEVYLEYPVGSRTDNTQFDPGSTIKVQVLNGNANVACRMAITWSNPAVSPYFDEGTLTFMGNGWFITNLPSVVTKGTISIQQGGWFGTNPVLINIGVGTIADVTKPPTNTLNQLATMLKYTAIAAGVIAVIWVASKAAPGIVEGYKRSRLTSHEK
jgi:alanine dehydrogenase